MFLVAVTDDGHVELPRTYAGAVRRAVPQCGLEAGAGVPLRVPASATAHLLASLTLTNFPPL